MYYRIIPFSQSFDTYGLIYSANINTSYVPWTIVEIPYWKSTQLGICYSVVWEKNINCNSSDIKEIIGVFNNDLIFLSQQQLELVSFISEYYITPIHNVLGLFFPRNLFEKISKNSLWKIKVSDYTYKNPEIKLSSFQEELYKKIHTKNHLHHLIYWVTWSGKTQIYMKLISDALKQDKQSLLLIPEIILTSQIWERVQAMFWDDVLILHSWVTAAKKAKYWMDIHSSTAKIIIGTRSSLFYPYNNLGLIIIDEEHDSSYISDSAPRYHTLDVAQRLSQLYDIPLVLGSWTPRTTTLYKWLKWDFQILQLLEKYSD